MERERLGKRFTFSNFMSVAALFVALGGSSCAVLAVLPAGALGAPKPVPPGEILGSSLVTGLRVAVSSADEAMAVIGLNNSPSDPSLLARVRGADGNLGPVDEISRNTSADLPREIRFSPRGDLLLAWGAGSGARGEHAFRSRRGSFSAPATWSGTQCGRYSAVRYGTDGLPQVACSVKIGSGGTPNGVAVLAATAPSGFAYGSPDVVQAATYNGDYFPYFDVGPDGTRAVIWSISLVDPTIDMTTSALRLAVAPPGGSFGPAVSVEALVSELGLDTVSPLDVKVLADGRVAVLYQNTYGLYISSSYGVAIRSAGASGTITKTTLPGGAGGWAAIAPDGADALVGWATKDLFNSSPTTLKVAKLSSSASGVQVSGTQTLDSNVSGIDNVDVDVSAGGAAAVMRAAPVNGARTLSAWYRPARGRPFQGPFPIASASTISSARMAMDRFGSLAAVWVQSGTPVNKVMLGGLDAAGPTLSGLSIPGRLRVGRSGAVNVRAADPSGVAKVTWSFGDGKSATGAASKHKFTRPGRFTVKVVATDRAGQQSKSSRVVVVGR